jgi:branched-chain amino acid transport system substrate-binding protein
MRLFVVLLAVIAVAGCSGKGATEPIWIGHVATISGPDKAAGEHAKQGIQFAVEDANQEDNRIMGRKVMVRHANAKTEGDGAEAEAVRLVSINKVVALLGGTDAVQAERLARGAQTAGVPLIVQTGLPASAINDNTYSCSVSPARRGQALGRYAKAKLDARRVVVVIDTRGAVHAAVADAFAKEFAGDGVTRLEYKSDADFAGLAVRVPKTAQAILVAGAATDLAKLRAELNKAVPSVPLFFGGDEGSLPALLNDREPSEGIYVATPYVADDRTARNEAFVKKYRDRFHKPPDANAALAYDGARLLFEALRKAKTTGASKLREELPNLEDFESLTGPLSFGKDHHARRAVFIVQLKDGKPEQKERYEADKD